MSLVRLATNVTDGPDKLIIKVAEQNNMEMWSGSYPDTND